MKNIGKLHVLTDTVVQSRFSHLDLARLALEGGAHSIQMRQKTGPTREMIDAASRMARLCEEREVSLLVNDRVDVAFAAQAHGVHLGRDDFPIALARELLGVASTIGGSASSIEEAKECRRQGADYIGFGPIYPTSSKADAGQAKGLELLKEVVKSIDLPVIAIGGINSENAGEVMKAGAYGIAVISSVCCREDPRKATRELQRIISGRI